MSNRQRLRPRCRHPSKRKYASRIVAYAAMAALNQKGQTGLSAYQCPAGHWHVGRFKVGGNT